VSVHHPLKVLVDILTDAPSEERLNMHMDFIVAIDGAVLAVTENQVIRSSAHTAANYPHLRKRMIKQYLAFEDWQRKQKAQAKANAKAKVKAKAKGKAKAQAPPKAKGKPKAKAKAKAKATLPIVS
jgi:hypothetical protein